MGFRHCKVQCTGTLFIVPILVMLHRRKWNALVFSGAIISLKKKSNNKKRTQRERERERERERHTHTHFPFLPVI